MNKPVQQAIYEFHYHVWQYMKDEYKPKWAKLYDAEDTLDEMFNLDGQYYLGGNNVPDTAGDIVRLLKRKYQ
jgi:hypothetical protein